MFVKIWPCDQTKKQAGPRLVAQHHPVHHWFTRVTQSRPQGTVAHVVDAVREGVSKARSQCFFALGIDSGIFGGLDSGSFWKLAGWFPSSSSICAPKRCDFVGMKHLVQTAYTGSCTRQPVSVLCPNGHMVK